MRVAVDEFLASGIFIGLYSLATIGLAFGLAVLQFSELFIIVMVAPLMFASVRFPRLVYVSVLVIYLGATLALAWVRLPAFSPDYFTVVIASLVLLIVAELIFRLLAERSRGERELQGLHQVSIALTSSLDPSAVLDAILETAFQLNPNAKDAHIYLYRDEQLIFAASLWDDGRKNDQFAPPRPSGLTWKVASSGQVIAIPDMQRHPFFSGKSLDWSGAIAGIPLKIGQRVVGVMNIAYHQPRRFRSSELRVLELLGGQAAIAIENARLFDETRHRAERMAVLNEVGQALTATVKLGELYRMVYHEVSRVLKADVFFIAIYDESQGVLHFPLVYEDSQEYPSGEHPLDQGPTSQVIRSRKPLFLNNPVDMDRLGMSQSGSTDRPSLAALFVPIHAGSKMIGVISVQTYLEGAYQSEDLQVLETIAAQTAIAIENARLYDELEQEAITDELTGLSNRRGLFQLGQREIERAHRFKRPLSAIMLDIDHFKQVNDTYGHAAGDRVLRALTQCCRESVRTIDLVGRYGGEEFFLLLPESELTAGVHVAERLRRSVENCAVPIGRDCVHFTISLGVVALTPDTPNLASLIDRADRAQYIAKQSGRNRVSVLE